MKVPQMGRTQTALFPLGLLTPPSHLPVPSCRARAVRVPAQAPGPQPAREGAAVAVSSRPVIPRLLRPNGRPCGQGQAPARQSQGPCHPNGAQHETLPGTCVHAPRAGHGSLPTPVGLQGPVCGPAPSGSVLHLKGPAGPDLHTVSRLQSNPKTEPDAENGGGGEGLVTAQVTAPLPSSAPQAGQGTAVWGTDNQRNGLPGPFRPFPPVTSRRLHSTWGMEDFPRTLSFF